jgi:hypothetical protein
MVKQNLPSFGRARKEYIYLLQNSKKKEAALAQDLAISQIVRLRL